MHVTKGSPLVVAENWKVPATGTEADGGAMLTLCAPAVLTPNNSTTKKTGVSVFNVCNLSTFPKLTKRVC
jgi:hypothetical protein